VSTTFKEKERKNLYTQLLLLDFTMPFAWIILDDSFQYISSILDLFSHLENETHGIGDCRLTSFSYSLFNLSSFSSRFLLLYFRYISYIYFLCYFVVMMMMMMKSKNNKIKNIKRLRMCDVAISNWIITVIWEAFYARIKMFI
jgi:hypothetical protein